MMNAIRRALAGFADKEGWATLTARAMSCDYSWGRSANEYIKIYKDLLKK